MIQIRIAFVLRLVDDFTGACIKRKSFRFWTDEKILHPVQKEEGLYVFLEPLEHPARITIEGTDYYPCTVEVDKHILDPEEPIADIRLYGRSGKVYSGGRGISDRSSEHKRAGTAGRGLYTKRKTYWPYVSGI